MFFCVCGCNQFDVEEVLLVRDDVSLTVKGEPVFVYEPDNCQTAYNSERNEYRAMTDDLSRYFVLRADQTLSDIGQEFSADLIYKTDKKEKTEKSLTFKIEKISNADGLVWLWCSSRNIGLVIRVF
jgi:hypothetical protein